jgi:hypothetical protein
MDIDTVTTQVADRMDALEATVRDRLTPTPVVRTTWPRRLLWAAVGFAAGTAAAYLGDPDRGAARRADLQDRVTATGNDVMDRATKRADDAAGRAKGVAADTVNVLTPEDVPEDLKTLEAKVRSEVFGSREDVDKVVLRVDRPGEVAVKGTVPSATAERELLSDISQVEGVTDVRSELTVAG